MGAVEWIADGKVRARHNTLKFIGDGRKVAWVPIIEMQSNEDML